MEKIKQIQGAAKEFITADDQWASYANVGHVANRARMRGRANEAWDALKCLVLRSTAAELMAAQRAGGEISVVIESAFFSVWPGARNG